MVTQLWPAIAIRKTDAIKDQSKLQQKVEVTNRLVLLASRSRYCSRDAIFLLAACLSSHEFLPSGK